MEMRECALIHLKFLHLLCCFKVSYNLLNIRIFLPLFLSKNRVFSGFPLLYVSAVSKESVVLFLQLFFQACIGTLLHPPSFGSI